MGIQLIFSNSSNEPSKNMGATTPSWFGQENNRGTWHSSPNAFDFLFWYNLVTGSDSKSMFVQYGQNKQGWGSGRFFVQEIQILEEIENEDKSIEVKIRSRVRQFKQEKTTYANAGYKVNYKINLLGNEVMNYNGQSIDTISNNGLNFGWFIKTFIVQPKQTEKSSGMEFTVSYPNGEFTPNKMFLGFALYNPNNTPPEFEDYVPMAQRKSGEWLDLDTNNGYIKIRRGSGWVDKSTETDETSKQENKGSNRIRKNGKWLQLPKMKGSNVDG